MAHNWSRGAPTARRLSGMLQEFSQEFSDAPGGEASSLNRVGAGAKVDRDGTKVD